MLLPPELKLSIVDHLDPFSTFNFGLTSQYHLELCRPVLGRHAHSFAEAPVVDAFDVWRVLRDVLQDDSKAQYVTELSLPANWEMQPPTTPVEDADLLREAAISLLDIYPQLGDLDDLDEGGSQILGLRHHDEPTLMERIVEGVATGSPPSIIVVLIHHLPNLKTLRMSGSTDRDDIEHGILDEFLLKVSPDLGNAEKASYLPFRRLRTVALSYWNFESYMTVNYVFPFLHIPSLRTLAGHALSGWFWASNQTNNTVHLRPRSNIEEFFFVDCQFNASAVEYMLSCTQALKRFTYSAGGYNVSPPHYNVDKVVKSLSEHTWHSLEQLLLIHPYYREEEVRTPSRSSFHIRLTSTSSWTTTTSLPRLI